MNPRWQLPLHDRLDQAAQWAQIDPAPLLAQAAAIAASFDTGNPRVLDGLLRTICPADMWDWPAYTAYAKRVDEKPTRLRMVAALAHRFQVDAHWSERIPQLLQNIDFRPLWQFRACGDSRDPPACRKLSGRTERFDAAFWQTQNPSECDRVICRCSIRAYRLDEKPMAPADLKNNSCTT